MVRFRDVLFKKNFFPLWLGQIISEFGDRLNQMALIPLFMFLTAHVSKLISAEGTLLVSGFVFACFGLIGYFAVRGEISEEN